MSITSVLNESIQATDLNQPDALTACQSGILSHRFSSANQRAGDKLSANEGSPISRIVQSAHNEIRWANESGV